jgi:hypothetical protein
MAAMASSMQRSRSRPERAAGAVVLALLLAGCLGETPDRARILEAHVVTDTGRAELELTQDLRLSRTMTEALEHGIPLRLVYGIRGCGNDASHVLELRYVPLLRHYELRRIGSVDERSFARRGAMLAALDRLRLPLAQLPAPGCRGRVAMALDLTSLPTPLRFPALLRRDEWRLISPATAWTTPSARA